MKNAGTNLELLATSNLFWSSLDWGCSYQLSIGSISFIKLKFVKPRCSNLLFMPLSQLYFCIHWVSGLVSNSPTKMTNNNLITGTLQITAENDNDWLVALSVHSLLCCFIVSLSEISFSVAIFQLLALNWDQYLSNPDRIVCICQDKIDFVKKVRKRSSSRTKCVIQPYDLGAVNAAFRKLHGLGGLLTSPPGVLLSDVYKIQVTAPQAKRKEPENCKTTDGALGK